MPKKECKADKTQVNEHYDKQWESYSEDDVLLRVKNLGPVLDAILSPCEFEEGERVLDLGTGPCAIPLRLAQKKKNTAMVGIDISQKALKLGKRVLESGKLGNIHLIMGDCEKLPFSPESFDFVLSNATFNLLFDKQKAFYEMARVLKNGGSLVLGDCVAKTCNTKCSSDPTLWSQCVSGAMTRSQILDLAGQNRLSVLEVIDLTKTVKDMVEKGDWDYKEFLEHELEYMIFVLKK